MSQAILQCSQSEIDHNSAVWHNNYMAYWQFIVFLVFSLYSALVEATPVQFWVPQYKRVGKF